MGIDDDIEMIARQEQELQFDSFSLETGWALGSLLRRMSVERQYGVAIDVTLFSMPVFFTVLDGATPDNPHWVRRKRACVFRFLKSSYALGLSLKKQDTTLQAKFGLPDADYASHGGSFPILVKGTGCIGAVTVSGLPQRDDHNVVVEALAKMLDRDMSELTLA